jgi:hypothetical protein
MRQVIGGDVWMLEAVLKVFSDSDKSVVADKMQAA